MNILVPMAGRGSRFLAEKDKNPEYSKPKPIINIHGRPMIKWALSSLPISNKENLIFLVLKEHVDNNKIDKELRNIFGESIKIIVVDKVTEGAACTALLAKNLINNESPLLIVNGDQFLEWNSNEFFYAMAADSCDGGMVTFNSSHPKWSFAKLGEDGFVSEVAEKIPISNMATAGIYYYKKGSEFVKYAEQMIFEDKRVNNEFFICPIYNEMIKDNKKIRAFKVEKMWGLGTPEDLNIFLNKYQSTY